MMSAGNLMGVATVEMEAGGSSSRARDGGVDNLGIQERFVALHVYEDLAIHVGGHFRDALGSGAVVRAGHAGFTAEASTAFNDSVVVGRYDHAGGQFREFGALVNSLDHGSASEGHQWFAGQAR